MAGTSANRSVGRPREFDEEAVLEAAMDAFCLKGYEATSLADLCRCTGLHKGSLYQTFGDKHELFMRSLQHYVDEQFREVAAVAFRSESPLENLKAAVKRICDDAGDGKGCMMINSLVELAPHDPDVKKTVQAAGEKRIRAITDMLSKAQQIGEIRSGQDPYKLARQLMMTLAGGAALVKGILEKEEIVETLDGLIESWI